MYFRTHTGGVLKNCISEHIQMVNLKIVFQNTYRWCTSKLDFRTHTGGVLIIVFQNTYRWCTYKLYFRTHTGGVLINCISEHIQVVYL